MKQFLKHSLKKSSLYRGLKVAALVGLLLALINHYDVIFAGTLNQTHIFKILLTFLVPFSVSIISSGLQERQMEIVELKEIIKIERDELTELKAIKEEIQK